MSDTTDPLKQNAPAVTRAFFETKLNSNYKRMPAYGKRLMKMRCDGMVPARPVIVSFEWNIGGAYPRIVITDEFPVAELNFGYLAGLAVQIVYRGKDAHRVHAVVEAIMKVKPSSLTTFAIDLAGTDNPAFTLIQSPLDILATEIP